MSLGFYVHEFRIPDNNFMAFLKSKYHRNKLTEQTENKQNTKKKKQNMFYQTKQASQNKQKRMNITLKLLTKTKILRALGNS